MLIKKLRLDLEKKLTRYGLRRKFTKAKVLFEKDPRYPGLHTELLESKQFGVYSFRLDRKFRALFIIVNGKAEITDINLHYQ